MTRFFRITDCSKNTQYRIIDFIFIEHSTICLSPYGCDRMEKVDMKRVRCVAKVVGTVVTVGGAMLMTLYKGNVLNFPWSAHSHASNGSEAPESTDKDWFKGSIFLIIATLAWASFFILQVTKQAQQIHICS